MPTNDEIIKKINKRMVSDLGDNADEDSFEDTAEQYLREAIKYARADERKKHTKIIKGICPEGKHQEILEAGIRQGKRETAEEIFRVLDDLLKKYRDTGEPIDYIDKEDLEKLKSKYLKGEMNAERNTISYIPFYF